MLILLEFAWYWRLFLSNHENCHSLREADACFLPKGSIGWHQHVTLSLSLRLCLSVSVSLGPRLWNCNAYVLFLISRPHISTRHTEGAPGWGQIGSLCCSTGWLCEAACWLLFSLSFSSHFYNIASILSFNFLFHYSAVFVQNKSWRDINIYTRNAV